MTPKSGSAAPRGRPPRVTAQRLREAILEIEGEEPTMAGLARQLGVGVATLYSHVRGQEELRRLAADTAFDSWELPEVTRGMHWATWAYAFARDQHEMIQRYPTVTASRPMAGGQLRYVERVLERLTGFGFPPRDALHTFYSISLLNLGVGTQIAAMRAEDALAEGGVWELFHEAMDTQRGPLPTLEAMKEEPFLDRDEVFDDLVWFTLAGIARRRGEVLPARP